MAPFLSTEHLSAFNTLVSWHTSRRKTATQYFPNLFVLELPCSPVGRSHSTGVAENIHGE